MYPKRARRAPCLDGYDPVHENTVHFYSYARYELLETERTDDQTCVSSSWFNGLTCKQFLAHGLIAEHAIGTEVWDLERIAVVCIPDHAGRVWDAFEMRVNDSL